MRAKRRKTGRMYRWLTGICAVAAGIFFLWQSRAVPVLSAAAEHLAVSAAESAFSAGVDEVLPEMAEEWLVMQAGENGEIRSVQVNSQAVNLLRVRLSEAIQRQWEQTPAPEAGIPLGSLLGSGILYGRGPVIKTKLLAAGSSRLSFSSRFTEAGVNQTHWRLVLSVETEVTVLFVTEKVTVNVPGEYVVAEMLIAGAVPESWTRLDSDGAWSILTESGGGS